MLFKSCKIALLVAATLVLSSQLIGCASTKTPQMDAKFGDSVRAARKAQTLNPTGPVSTDPVSGLDGKSAVNTLERYQDSFKSPPKTFEILNIGGSMSGN